MSKLTAKKLTKVENLHLRENLIGPQCSVFYKDEPLKVIRASNQYLYEEDTVPYLDCISNVQHVGHCHPDVVEAVANQFALTTCNSRFLHDNIVLCAQRLVATLPEQLTKCYFVNSGSEANDLAYRIATDYTGGTDVIVLDHAYHGHLSSTIRLSPYKFNGKGGKGRPDEFVHVAPCPDVYRGVHRLNDADMQDPRKLAEAGQKYADEVQKIIKDITSQGRRLAAFYMEALISCGGQIVPPPGYLRNVLKYVHDAGGLVVVDEVQSGFGRVGKEFWAFQLQGRDLTPDIVTMGKPMGNGFPVSAVVTKPAIAAGFCKGGMEYFNTYGGNPVSCAVVLAVMNVMEREFLQEHARIVGDYLLNRLRQLQSEHSDIIGDVRGVGLFIGIDLVKNYVTREPADGELVKKILYGMKSRRVLLSSEGPHGNIIKIKPPMCFTKENADEVVTKLGEVITAAKASGYALTNGHSCSNGNHDNL